MKNRLNFLFMRNLFWIISFVFAFLLLFSSCSDSKTYARELSAEKALIESFIKRNGIRVVETLPSDSVFLNNKNLYYKSTSGLYYRLEKEGRIDKDTIDLSGDLVRVDARYREYTLELNADTANYWSPNRYPYGASFIYGSSTQSTAAAFLEAVSYMRKTEAEAKLIVPSKIGFNSSVVTPYGYDLRIQFRKDTVPD